MSVPLKFLNKTFMETSSTNTEDFLEAKGLFWLTRRWMLFRSRRRPGYFCIEPIEQLGHAFNLEMVTFGRRYKYLVELGKAISVNGYDGRRCEVTFTVEGDRIKEARKSFKNGHVHIEEYIYYDLVNNRLRATCSIPSLDKTPTCRVLSHGRRSATGSEPSSWIREYYLSGEKEPLFDCPECGSEGSDW